MSGKLVSCKSWRLVAWLLFVVVQFVQWWQPVDASILLKSNNLSLQLPTYDYFEAPQSFYNVTGVLIYPKFEDTGSCTLQSGFFLGSESLNQPNSASIVTFDWSTAEQAGCHTIAQVRCRLIITNNLHLTR
jgi:hypothetical protein